MKSEDQLYLIRMGLAFLSEAGVPITKSMSATILDTAMSHARACSGRRGAAECNTHLKIITAKLYQEPVKKRASRKHNSR